MNRRLIVSDGKRERALVLVERLVVGRDPACDLTHDHDLLSRRHAEFVADGDAVTVRDLGSRNGVFVNGFRTAERTLSAGDVVQVGPLRILYAHDSTSAISPEQLVSDATVVVPPPAPRPAQAPAAARTPSPPLHDDDDDRTRVVMAPREPKPEPVPSPPQAPAPGAHAQHDEPTLFLAPPRDAAGASPARSDTQFTPRPPAPRPPTADAFPAPTPELTLRRPPPAAPAPPVPDPLPLPVAAAPAPGLPAGASARAVDADIAPYVFTHLGLLATMVVVFAVAPVWLWHPQALGLWVAIPAAAAIVGTYLIGRLVSRRFLRILRVFQPDRSGDVPGGPAGNPPGSPRV